MLALRCLICGSILPLASWLRTGCTSCAPPVPKASAGYPCHTAQPIHGPATWRFARSLQCCTGRSEPNLPGTRCNPPGRVVPCERRPWQDANTENGGRTSWVVSHSLLAYRCGPQLQVLKDLPYSLILTSRKRELSLWSRHLQCFSSLPFSHCSRSARQLAWL